LRAGSFFRAAVLHLLVLLAVGAAPVVPETARADNVSLSAQFEYLSSDSETENKITLDRTESGSSVFRQRYNLNLSRNIYPYLVFRGGGSFKIEDTESDFEGGGSEVEKTTLRPYLELKLANPFIITGLGYQSMENRRKLSGSDATTDTRTTYYTFLSLRPDDLPELDLKYSRTNRSSDPKTTDRVEDLVTVHSRYPFEGGIVDYAFNQSENKDRINDFRTVIRSHNAKIQHARSFADGTVNINTGYWFSHSETDLEGGGSTLVPQLRSAGLFSLDITPEDGPALGSIGGLIDGILDAPTSIDIGLAGDESELTNIGLDLGFTAAVDTVHLWVDRELTPEVADSFTWYVYTSPDNTDNSEWELHATVSPGDFGTFENRFEISFSSVQTRFIKVVVMPLLPSVPGASGFPNIFVTEMEAFTRITSQDGFQTLSHNLNYNIAWRISDRTTTGYDWFFRNRKSEPADIETTSMTNGVFINHVFSKIFTGGARASRQDLDDPGGESATNNYSASLRANYLPTFRQALTYSGTRTYGRQSDSRSDGLFLRNNADLYHGWSAYLDTGLTWSRDEDRKARSLLTRVGTKLVPNEIVTLNLDYTANRTQSAGEDERLKETGNFQAFILPSRNLSLFARLQYVEEEDSRSTLQNYDINWAPNPGGSVQLFLSYNQRILSEGNVEETVLSPGLRWRITRYATFRTTYSLFESDSDTESRDSRNLTANLRLNL
jgi:hypothetical protein